MNKTILIVLITTTFYSCTQEEDIFSKNTELICKWNLIEQLVDPGDGSGTFQPIDSERTIEFFKNGKVVSNGSFCSMSSNSGQKSYGVFNDNKEIITPKEDCNSSEYKIYYKLIDGYLHLSYQCIEGCAQKFEKISN